MPVAFPRFHDIYREAKVHESWGRIDDQGGKTFEDTLDRALRSKSPMVQIATWNDWGEGTIIEPSLEFGYRDLEVIQRLRRQHVEPGFSPRADDLHLPLRLYELRKAAGTAPRPTANSSTSPTGSPSAPPGPRARPSIDSRPADPPAEDMGLAGPASRP